MNKRTETWISISWSFFIAKKKGEFIMKTNIGYKLFKVKASQPGKIFPLYVNADKEVPIGEWIEAECGELTQNGKVKSKLGELAFRPGWHLNEVPYVTHIGKKDENGNIAYLPEDLIWAEVEYSDTINYQPVANLAGTNKKGKIIPKNAYIKEIPVNGYYKYKTNPSMTGEWIIAGAIKITRVISDQEVLELCKSSGYVPFARFGGEFDSEKYGFAI